MVKKKAALTLLRLYRKYPDIIPAAEWALRIVAIMDDLDLVSSALSRPLCSLTFLPGSGQLRYKSDNGHGSRQLGCLCCLLPKGSGQTKQGLCLSESRVICIDKRIPDRYRGRIFCDIRLLQSAFTMATGKTPSTYPILPSFRSAAMIFILFDFVCSHFDEDDPTVRSVLYQVLQTIMNNSAEQSRNVQHNNALNAVLFEAISLAIHIDTSSPLVGTAAVLLARFISSKETNVRYLGLDTMAHLAARADSLDAIKKHQGTIILSLRDKDISVRRRALDLLYSMCDVDNAELIVGELLQYLKVADYGLREEMVLKIAILTEKYSTSYKWYVDTILQLISAAGDHVGDEVWYRVVQITTNTEDLQAYAARAVFEHLRSPSCHESLIKVGGE